MSQGVRVIEGCKGISGSFHLPYAREKNRVQGVLGFRYRLERPLNTLIPLANPSAATTKVLLDSGVPRAGA
jgi:hypothetical protein